jgi:hypothetical protein
MVTDWLGDVYTKFSALPKDWQAIGKRGQAIGKQSLKLADNASAGEFATSTLRRICSLLIAVNGTLSR